MDANQPAPVAVSLAPTTGFVEMDLADADARFSDTASRTDSRARAHAREVHFMRSIVPSASSTDNDPLSSARRDDEFLEA